MEKNYPKSSIQSTKIFSIINVRIVVVLFFFLYSNAIIAQGTTCATATSITIGGCAVNDNMTDTTQTNPAITGCATGTFSREGWYTFTVSGGPLNLTITAVSTERNLFLQLISSTSNCAGTLTQIACANNVSGNGAQTETINATLNNGNYYVKVVNVGSNGNMFLASLCVTVDNDVCAGAIPLTSNTACSTTTGSTIGATDNNETGDCTNGTETAVWYQFTAVSTTQVVTVDGIAGFNAVIGALNNCGSAIVPTGGACVNATGDNGIETMTLTNLTIGQSYKIQVYDSNGDQTANGFTICLTHVAPTITSFSPTSGCPGSSVTITGTNFTGATAVYFNGIAATGYTVDNATQITATIPSGSTGGSISVVTPGGNPTRAGFSPTATNTAGGASSTPTLCINTALASAITHTTTGATGIGSPSDLPTGVTATWSGNTITINGTPSVSGTFNYSIPLTGGCGSVNATGTITVTAVKTVGAASSTPTLCINTALISAITHTTTGATGIDSPTSLPAGVTATWSANIITITGTPTVSGTFIYSIPLTGGCGSASATGTITVTAANTVNAASSTPTLCINTALVTSITHTTTGATGIGTPTSLPAGVTATWSANTITINGTPTESGTFNYSIPLTGGCGGLSATGTITVTAVNTASGASSAPTLCINTALTNITHTTTVATGILNNGVSGANGLPAGVSASWSSNTITISGTPTNAGTFNYSILLTGGCGSINATGTIIVENPVDAAGIILGTATVCQGQNGVSYSVPAIANTTNYIWSLPTGASVATGTGTNSITVNFSASALSGDINVLGTNSCGNGIVSANYPIIVNPLPASAGSITGTPTVCQGQSSVVYSVPIIANTINYIWTLPAGASIVSGSNTNSITVDFSTSAISGNITVQGTNACGNGIISANYPVIVNTLSIEPTSISGTSTICEGTSTSLSLVGGTLGTSAIAEWFNDSCGGTSAGTGNSINVSPIITTTYYVRYNGTCNITSCASVAVTVNPLPLPAGIISGTANVCQNQNGVVYSAPTIANATNYVWTLPTGGTIISGNNTNSITVDFSTSAISGNITVQGTNSCGNGIISTSYAVTVNPLPVSAGSISGTATVCQGQNSVIYSVPVIANTTNYIWTLPTGATIESGSNTNSITVDFSTTAVSGNITVQGANSCGNGIISANYPITVNTLSIAPTNITGTTTTCESASTLLSLVGGTSGTGAIAQWYNDSCGGTLIGTGNSINVSPIITTPYYVRYSGTCNTTSCASVTVTVNPLPLPAGIISGTAIICQGQSGIVYSVPTIANATNYVWTLPAGASIVSGSNTNSITVDFSMSALSGNITVQGTNACGNGIISINYPITVSITPSITSNYSSTICSAETATVLPANAGGNIVPPGTTYSWGLPTVTGGITGATALSNQISFSQTLTNPTNLQQTASYNVTASTNGCSTTTFSVLVYVNPKPTVSGTPLTQPICSGGTITTIALSNPNGISGTIDYSWTRDNTTNVTGIGTPGTGANITGNLTNTTNTPQTTIFTAIATTDNNCSSIPFTVSVVVNPNPTATVSPANQTICTGDAIAINMASTIGTYNYSWTSSNPSVTDTLTASGNTISGNLSNVTNTVQNTTYTITATLNGCSAVIGTANVSVKPRPTVVAAPLTQTLCGGVAISNITSTSNGVTGTTFTWVRDNTTLVTGMANSGSGTTISGTPENFNSTNQTVNFTITAIADGCSFSVNNVQVIVKPKPQLTMSPGSQNICSNSTFGAITITTSNSLSGATGPFSWTRDNVFGSGGFISGTSSGTGNIPNTITLVNNATTTQNTVFSVSASSNGCSNTVTSTVTVYAPLTVPVISASQDVCNFQTPSAFYMSTPVTGGSGTYTYQWQRSARGAGAAGPWTNVATTATYTAATNEFDYRLIVTDSFCTSKTVTSNTVYINVLGIGGILDSASLTSVPTTPLCNGAIPAIGVNITHTALSSVKFNWSSNNSYITPASGGPVGTSSGGFFPTTSYTFNFSTANTTNATQSTIVTVTPAFTNGLGTCNSNATTMTIQTRPIPKVDFQDNMKPIICHADVTAIRVRGNITDAPMIFDWQIITPLPTGVTASSLSGNSGSITNTPSIGNFDLAVTLNNTSAIPQDISIRFTPRSNYASNNCTGTAVIIIVKVLPIVTSGIIASSQAICSGQDPAAFTETTGASGLGTFTYQWQNRTTGSTPWNNIGSATSITYDSTDILTQTTWYRRVVTSTYSGVSCPVETGNILQVTVNNITPGTISGTQTHCSPTLSQIGLSSLTTATGTGNISYQWERSTTDCNSGFSDILLNGNSASYNVPAGLTTTTYFRRRDISITQLPTPVKTCFAYTNCVTVFINNVTGGTVGSDQTLCGNNPAAFTEITPSTASGTITYQWQSSTTGCSGWSPISGATGAVYDAPAGLLVPTYYQRITYSTLNSVICSAVSNCITVNVNTVTPGTISGNRTVCYGSDPAIFTETLAATGSNLSYQWQISTTSSAGPWNNISGAISSTYDAPGPINQITYFRRVVTASLNGNDCSVNSDFVTVFVNNVTASVISGNQNVCNGIDNPNAFTENTAASGNGALSYQWQSSTTGCSGPWADIPLATANTYDSPAVTQTTYFHVRVTSRLNGVDCVAFSNCLEITSFGKLWDGSESTDWSNNLNWTPAGVPDATNCVIIPNVLNKPVISGLNYQAFALNISILANSKLEITSNNSITVTDFVNVNPTAEFIIRNNASLIQSNNTAANVGSIKYTRTSRPMTRWGYVYWGSPIVENAFSQIPWEFDLKYRWQSGTLTGNWLPLSSIAQGEGFIARVRNTPPFSTGVGTVDFTFNGTPGNGIVNVNVDSYDSSTLTSAGNTVLLANPYPSAIDAAQFLTNANNTELGGTLFFWTSITLYSGTGPYNILDYGSWNLSGGVGTSPATDPSNLALKPNGKIASGQGFFAQVFADGNITFNNNMRIPNFNNQFFKNGNSTTSNDSENNRVWLNLYSNNTFRQMMVNYKEGATNGYERLYDGNSLTSNEINIYSILGDRNLVIQGRALPFDENDVVPLGYRITNPGIYSISIDELDGIFAGSQNVYLKDKLLNIVHDIKLSPYSFNTTAGTFDNRFEIVYVSTALGTTNPSEIKTFAVISNDVIRVESSELLKEISVYDISGKLINKYILKDYKKQFSDVFNYPNGVYIAKITLENGLIVTTKLIH